MPLTFILSKGALCFILLTINKGKRWPWPLLFKHFSYPTVFLNCFSETMWVSLKKKRNFKEIWCEFNQWALAIWQLLFLVKAISNRRNKAGNRTVFYQLSIAFPQSIPVCQATLSSPWIRSWPATLCHASTLTTVLGGGGAGLLWPLSEASCGLKDLHALVGYSCWSLKLGQELEEAPPLALCSRKLCFKDCSFLAGLVSCLYIRWGLLAWNNEAIVATIYVLLRTVIKLTLVEWSLCGRHLADTSY
jgi:hypothetical protein